MSEETTPVAIVEPAAAAAGPVSHAIFRVARLHRMLARALLRQTGLYPGQELVMMHLWDAGPQRQVELIKMLDSDAATMTRTIQRLERAGFVRRLPSATDRRATIIEPTPASQALRRQVEDVWAHLEDLTLGDLGTQARATAVETLGLLERNLINANDDSIRNANTG